MEMIERILDAEKNAAEMKRASDKKAADGIRTAHEEEDRRINEAVEQAEKARDAAIKAAKAHAEELINEERVKAYENAAALTGKLSENTDTAVEMILSAILDAF